MQKLTFWVFPGVVLLLTGCKISNPTANGGVGQMSGKSAASTPIAPYECVQTKGDVSVTLMKVQRGTVFTTNTADIVRDGKLGKTYPIPVFDLAYRVEAKGDESIKTWNLGNEEIRIGNQPVDALLPDNLVPGGSSDKLMADTRRARIFQTQIRAAGIQAGEMTVSLTTGFNDHKETFVFTNVPFN